MNQAMTLFVWGVFNTLSNITLMKNIALTFKDTAPIVLFIFANKLLLKHSHEPSAN